MFITKLDRSKRKMKEDFKKIKINSSDFGGLSNYEEINNAFEEMCKAEKARISSLFQNDEEFPEAFRSFGASLQLSKKSSDDFHQKRQSFSPKSNGFLPTPGRKLAYELGSTPELMKEFGISASMMKKLGSGSRRGAKQVLDQMKARIFEDLEDLLDRQKQRENEEGYRELKKAYTSMKSGSEMQKKDIFWWMKVPTKSHYLKKKVRAKIVEYIGDGENYAKVKKALDERKKLSLNEEEPDKQVDSPLKSRSPKSLLGSMSGGSSEALPMDGIYQENTKLLLDNISFDSSLILDEFSKFLKNTALSRKKRGSIRSNLATRSGSMVMGSGLGQETGAEKQERFSHASSTIDGLNNLKANLNGNKNAKNLVLSPKSGTLNQISKSPSHFFQFSSGQSSQKDIMKPHLRKTHHKTSSVINDPDAWRTQKEEIVEPKIDRLNYKPNLENIGDKLTSTSHLREEDQWTRQKEEEFTKRRSKSRFQLTYLCNSSSWNDVAFGKMLNEIRYNDANKNFRNNLIEKYMHGEWLTEAEIRYVAITSECLNQFLDRDYFNQALEILDEEVIDKIEMNIAENIIKEYKVIRELVYNSRNAFLKQINKKKEKKIQETALRHQSTMNAMSPATLKRKQAKMKKVVEKTKQVLLEKEKKKTEKEMKKEGLSSKLKFDRNFPFKSLPNLEQTRSQSKETLGSIGNGNKPKEHVLRTQWQEFLKRNFQEEINTCLFGKISKKDFKHMNHPASKLFLTKGGSVVPSGLQKKQGSLVGDPEEDKIQKETEFFRLKINETKTKPGSSEIFRKTYSGGPREFTRNIERKELLNKKMNAIVMIQTAFRRNQAMKKAKAWKRNQQGKEPQKSLGILSKQGSSTNAFSITIRNSDQRQTASIRLPREGSIANMLPKNGVGFEPTQGESKRIIAKEALGTSKGRMVFVQGGLERRGSGMNLSQEEIPSGRKENQRRMSIGTPGMFEGAKSKSRKNLIDPSTLLKNKQLLAATKENHFPRVKSLSYNYSPEDINAKDSLGNSALWYSAKHGNLEMCRWVMERNPDPNLVCSEGTTAVHMAFASQNPFVLPS